MAVKEPLLNRIALGTVSDKVDLDHYLWLGKPAHNLSAIIA
jgi:hypothetical protein